MYYSKLQQGLSLQLVHDAHALSSGVVYRIIGIDIYYIDAVLNPCKARAAKAPNPPRHFQMRVTDGLRVHEEGALDERLAIRALLAYS